MKTKEIIGTKENDFIGVCSFEVTVALERPNFLKRKHRKFERGR
jgi:hypothetical protein